MRLSLRTVSKRFTRNWRSLAVNCAWSSAMVASFCRYGQPGRRPALPSFSSVIVADRRGLVQSEELPDGPELDGDVKRGWRNLAVLVLLPGLDPLPPGQ